MIAKEEKKILIELICNEQTHMIIKDYTKYESEKYKKLEELKVKIKDMWGGLHSRYNDVHKSKLSISRWML